MEPVSSYREELDDEINLADLVRSLWDGRTIILVCTVLTTLLAGGVAWLAWGKFTARLELLPIGYLEEQVYDQLNGLVTSPGVRPFVDPLQKDPSKTDEPQSAMQFFEINREKLTSAFADNLQTRREIVAVMRESGFLPREDYQSDQDYEAAILKEAYIVEILAPADPAIKAPARSRNLSPNWLIYYEGKGADRFRKLLGEVLARTNEAVRKDVVKAFEERLSAYEETRQFIISDYDRRIENLKRDSLRQKADSIAFYKEQAQIARALGIAKNTLRTDSVSSSQIAVVDVAGETPFYMRGYEAIEKELMLMEQRSNQLPFVAGLLDLEKARRALAEDPMPERARKIFARLPVSQSGSAFNAVLADVSALKIENSNRPLMILVLGVLGGLGLGCVLVLLRNALKSSKPKA